jgi:hypothetical protein
MDNIFNKEENKQDNPVIQDPNKQVEGSADNPLSQLVGEGKKYATQEELAKAYLHLDSFTAQLKDENKGMREDLSKRQTAQEILDQLKNEQSATPSKQEETNPALSLDKIQEMVRQTITRQEQENTASKNVQDANDFMVGKYGDRKSVV